MKWTFYFAPGWGSFPPGCADVEPRRCRRTDGKKWRCSRDAVGDQKYCERHINRGRHRSRKHVEGRKATLTIAEPSMVIAAGVSSRGHTVARQKQVKGSAATVSDHFSRQSNRWSCLILHEYAFCASCMMCGHCEVVFVKINDICCRHSNLVQHVVMEVPNPNNL